jgi:Domain of unknown function (DUF4234)
MSQTPPPPPPTAQVGGSGAIGEQRKPLTVVLLTIITCGIYGLWWYYRNFEDMKQHSGEGVGGLLGLLLAIFCGIIAIFILPAEVGNLYEREGKEKPIGAMTAFWNLIPLIGSIIFIYKVQNALNEYWAPKGARWAGSA